MKFVPNSVLLYASKIKWRGEDDVVFVSYFEEAKKTFIDRCVYQIDELLKENDAVVIFKEYLVFYKGMKCGLCTYDGKEVLSQKFDEICVMDDTDVPLYIETLKDSKANVYSIIERKFILPEDKYEVALVYDIGICVKENNLSGVTDFSGEIVLPPKYDGVWIGSKNMPYYITKSKKVFQAFDVTGELLFERNFPSFQSVCKHVFALFDSEE